ncbi:MAG: bifunctional phosphopantothenoylcysteine decarboxylase/phosphopantothenate--cysteine ligase CoaBC [Ginsengibacter sp.]
MQNIKGKKILLCVTGSIAAYKAVILLRLLIKSGAEVKVIMTKAAIDFVSPLTFSTLSKNKVLSNLFEEETWSNHVMLGRWADLLIIAPASCNTIAKLANGICESLLQAVYLSANCPVVIAPAMDEDMWHHPATKKNIQVLKSNGNKFLDVNNGELASGLFGQGRMAEPGDILTYVSDFFLKQNSLNGLKVLVTAGPTIEAIDPVRYISNRSTGTMGIFIAEEFASRGAAINLVLGPTEIEVLPAINTTRVISANDMYEATVNYLDKADVIVMAAAVADYTPENPAIEKIKKKENSLSIKLVKTNDILLRAGELKNAHQTLVGFALETNNEKENAQKKLANKNADLIVLNSLNDAGAGFGNATNKITIFDKKGNEYNFEKKSKREVAKDIVNAIINFRNV